ncbi:hypothetical protein GVO57_07310 [Sphingomonas changnyeongensis]|uniref:Uncharacterized protein n=1 Tax=Sphingomonas changnyeongensis TaxID=2698679 RepID=A0A7Z2S523_9SPHN|nr:hypothetical protein [Sphingomonas changnyeongensis]QHL90675.1 hypothetical protein GVO57_07310 [Sphingomonas changnyeongensis]
MRLVIGQGRSTPQAVGLLAFKIADAARMRGISVQRIAASHDVTSGSRYIDMVDARRQIWRFRVSNHRRPLKHNHHRPPHFDLVSIDAHSGIEQAIQWLDEIASGRLPHFTPEIRSARRRR